MMSTKGLSPKLLDELRDTLLDCGPFDSYPVLKAVFLDQRIRQWRAAIPSNTASKDLVNILISTLYEKEDRVGQNGLLLFLNVLHDSIDKNDGCRQRLIALIHRLEAEPSNLANKDTTPPGQGETALCQPTLSQLAAYEKPKYPEPGKRLRNLGFDRDPFAWPEAESIEPRKELEEFFVAPPRFDEYILDLDRSAVLLAPRGGGKTACRLLLSAHLNQLQRDALSGTSMPGQPAPFVVIYDDFEALLPALPGVTTAHHTAPLLRAVAEAMFKLLQNYSDHFLALPERRRQWWGQFLQAHLSPDMSPEERLDRLGNQALAAGLVGVSPASTSSAVSLKKRLTTFRGTLQQDFGLDHIYILIDGVDGYAETKSPTDLAGLLSPLLDGLSLLSLNGIIWKFFLPDFLAETVEASAGAHTGRCHVLSINWDKDSLIALLQLRLQWASAGQIRELSQICEGEMDVSEELAQMSLSHSLGPPRAILSLSSELFSKENTGPLLESEWNDFVRRNARSPFKEAIVSIRSTDERVVGTGFLVQFREKEYVVTCAHTLHQQNKKTGDEVKVKPFNVRGSFQAVILHMQVPAGKASQDWDALEDIVVLRIEQELPDSCRGFTPLRMNHALAENCSSYAYIQSRRTRGTNIKSIFYSELVDGGFVEASIQGSSEVDLGASGAPVVDPNDRLMGMIQARANNVVYIIPINLIIDTLEHSAERGEL